MLSVAATALLLAGCGASAPNGSFQFTSQRTVYSGTTHKPITGHLSFVMLWPSVSGYNCNVAFYYPGTHANVSAQAPQVVPPPPQAPLVVQSSGSSTAVGTLKVTALSQVQQVQVECMTPATSLISVEEFPGSPPPLLGASPDFRPVRHRALCGAGRTA